MRYVMRVGQYADASHLRLLGDSVENEDPYQDLMDEWDREVASSDGESAQLVGGE